MDSLCVQLATFLAEVAELVDAPASGAGGRYPVKVQVLSSAKVIWFQIII